MFPTSVNESPKINVTGDAADAMDAVAAKINAAKASLCVAILISL